MVSINKRSDFPADLKRNHRKKSLGFVPTMGALHEGHLTLIRAAKKQCEAVICSIFVNPTQFNNQDDFEKYPRVLDEDLKLLEREGVDYVFCPSGEDMYHRQSSIEFNVKHFDDVMEGAHRKGHFNGVLQIVLRLFNIIEPDKAFFGLKDLQQYSLIKTVSEDLFLPLEIVGVPTVRSDDGLALSSRNRRLSHEGLGLAKELNVALSKAKMSYNTFHDVLKAKQVGVSHLDEKGIVIEYFEECDADNFRAPNSDTQRLALCLAADIEGVRLIDNIVFMK